MSPQTTQTRTYILIALHLAFALPLAYYLNIWADEASSLYATRDGLLTAFHSAAVEQKQAPLYFWVLSLWREIDGSIFFARFFSIVCSVLAIRQFAAVGKRLLSPKAALIATAFFALHPYLIWASLEIRVYSLVILLSLLLVRLFYKVFIDKNAGLSAKAGFVLVALLSLYASYYLGFVIAGFFLVLLFRRKWKQVGIFLLMMLIVAIVCIPLVHDLLTEFGTKTHGYQDPKNVVEGLRIVWTHVMTFVLPWGVFGTAEPSGVEVIRALAVRIIAVIITVLTVVKRRDISSSTVEAGVVSAMIFGLLFLAYFAVGSPYVEMRHAAILFAPVILFVGLLVSDLARRLSERAQTFLLVSASLVVLVSFSFSLVAQYSPLAKRGDWARVADFIEQNETAGQPIVVFTTFDSLALPYHYNGVNRVLPDARQFDFITPRAKPGTIDSLRDETEFVITQIPIDADEIWVAVGEKCFAGEACTPLQNYLSANYTIETEKDFYQERLYLLRRKLP